MMENYQENCNKSDPKEQFVVISQENNINDKFCHSEIVNEENYNFGAEITEQVNVDNAEIKTINTVENITSTKTEQQCATKAETIITRAASSDTGISLEKCQSEKCDYDTAEDIGEDEADDENDDSPDDVDSPVYGRNPQPQHEGSVESSDDDTSSSTDSDFSDLSGLSDVSGKEWKPVNRKPILWVQKQIHSGRNPRELLSRFLPAGAQSIALGLNDMSLWRLLASVLSEPPRRQKLHHVNTFEDVIQLILNSKNIVVLTGAGVSVSCGIPDFRSSDGIYSRLAKDYPNLPDPQSMFDIDYFSRDPRPFYKFAREIYPGQFKPSPCHRFIKLLEEKELLLRNYTQNIDTLEQVAGIKRVIECHGSFSTASCTKCKFKCDAEAIRADIFAQRIPVCPLCQPHVNQSVDASEPVSENDLRWIVANGIMKPDIVFFGEGLPDEFHKVMASDKDKCDLLIVIGSSLKVRPVALIPSSLPANVPQILINREQLNHLEFDVELLGDSDVIINQICHRLGGDWKQICFDEHVLQESKELEPFENGAGDENFNEEFDDIDENASELEVTEIESQSIKPNITVGMNFRTTTRNAACSDSGFESSTSTSQTNYHVTESSALLATSTTIKATQNEDKLAEIENIKTSILELNERPIASDDSDFQPFSVRLGQDTLMTPPTSTSGYVTTGGEGLRHLSIDSTKDSGIQCDSSNSMATTNEFNELACSSSTPALKSATNTETKLTKSPQNNTVGDDPQPSSSKKQRLSKTCSAADFLIEGTYYYQKNGSLYIFPGAQISRYADETDSDLEEDHCDDIKVETPANKCEVDKEVTQTCDTNETLTDYEPAHVDNDCGIKRKATTNAENNTISCDSEAYSALSPKICRLENDFEATTPATAILTTTINTSTNCKNAHSMQEFTAAATSNTTLTLTDTKETLQDI